MKGLAFSLIALVLGQCSAYLIRVPTAPIKPRIGIDSAPVGWVHIQKLLFPLFENVCEESTNEIVIRLAGDFTLETTNGVYTKADVIDKLRNIKIGKGLLEKGEIFSEYNISHMNELKALYEVLYYAKDFDTFYKAACWARQNANCGLFVDAIYLAIMNRRDTAKISVPAPYELIPNYFIQRDVIVKASTILAGEDQSILEGVRVENNAYILDANYTAEIDDDNEDSKLAYFREDIGLNSYYFLRKLRNAPWFNIPSNVNSSYGEYMFLMMKQFAARYDLERYANGLPELDSISWDSKVAAYNPLLIYSNGVEFGHRTFTGILSESNDVTFLRTIENNLATIVTHLRQAGHNKTQILNHLMEILITSDKSYETTALRILGSDVESDRQYSTLEHYLTSMRDPTYWRVNKKIVELVDNALNVLPSYTRKDLYFPGVEVLNVETKKLMTLCEDFQFDVTDSLKTTTGNTNFEVKIAQQRLNHKPFTMKLNISSLVTQKGLVKIYLGPKTMPGEFTLKKHLFVLLDRFELDLKLGSNVLSRSSVDMKSFSDDFTSLRTVRKNIEDAEFGLNSLPLKDVEWQVGYPSRLILPKGLPEGLLLQLFVFVAPFTKNSFTGTYPTANNVEFNTALLSAGYPLDLDIDEKQLFNLPNVLIKDIIVTHKGDSKASPYNKSGPKSWDSNKPYDSSRFDYSIYKQNDYESPQYGEVKENQIHDLLSDRPAFTYKNKNSLDNSAKRNPYKNIGDYTSRRYEEKNDYGSTDRSIDFEGLNIKSEESDNVVSGKKHPGEYDNNNSALNKVHGLLGSQSKLINNRKETKRDQLTTNDDSSYWRLDTTKLYNNYDKDDKTIQNKLSIDDKMYNNQEDSKHSLDKTDDDNRRGILEDGLDITYKKKDTTDYSAKRKEKKEKYETKRAEFKNKENTSILDTNENQNDFNENKEDVKKTIVVDENTNIVQKSVTDNKSNKNIYVDKTNGGKYDTIIKEIVKGPYTDQNIKNNLQYPIKVGVKDKQAVIDYVEDADYSITYDPVRVPEIPRKRVSVYDYLFNYNDDNEKIYE